MAVLQVVPSAVTEGDETDPEAAEMVRLAALMPADETQLLYSICLHGRAELGLAPDEYAALTMVLLRLLAFKPVASQPAPTEKKTLNPAPPEEAPRVVSPTAAAPASPARPAPPLAPAASAAAPVATQPAPQPAVVTLPAAVAQAVASPSRLRVQPWEDEPNKALAPVEPAQAATKTEAIPASEQTPPPGQQLHVVNLQVTAGQPLAYESNKTLAPVEPAQAATKIVAVPVRVQADTRAEAAAGQSAAVLLVPTEEGEFWHLTVQQLIAREAITAMVRELALQSQLVARDTDQWILRVERESLNQPGSRDRLTTALQAAGHSVRLVVEVGRVTDSPARRNVAVAAEQQLAADKIIFDDPFVQTMMRDFGAKIVPGSIKPG
jgi:DNA polymerase-3 subunit gamma/tau